jgi:hypothetical protein
MRPIIRTPPSGRFGLNMEFRVFPDGRPIRSLHAVLALRIDIDVASITPRMVRVDPNIRIMIGLTMKLVFVMKFLSDRIEVRIMDFHHRTCGNMIVGHHLLLWFCLVMDPRQSFVDPCGNMEQPAQNLDYDQYHECNDDDINRHHRIIRRLRE